jgi:hypothetical protein
MLERRKTKKICYYLSMCSVLAFTGCTHYADNYLFPSKLSSAALLVCEQPRSCVDAKIIPYASTANMVALQIRITHEHHHYDIQRISFDNGQQMLSYMPIRPSMRAVGKGQYLSFTSISVPYNLTSQLIGPRLTMTIYTDRNVIKRYLAMDGQYAPLYLELDQRRIIR